MYCLLSFGDGERMLGRFELSTYYNYQLSFSQGEFKILFFNLNTNTNVKLYDLVHVYSFMFEDWSCSQTVHQML